MKGMLIEDIYLLNGYLSALIYIKISNLQICYFPVRKKCFLNHKQNNINPDKLMKYKLFSRYYIQWKPLYMIKNLHMVTHETSFY